MPIGAVDAHRQKEFAAGPVAPLPAYESIRPDVIAATRAMKEGESGSQMDPSGVDREAAVRREEELVRELELQDEHGEPIAVDSIWLNDLGDGSRISAIIIFKGASSTIRNMLRPQRRA